MSASYQPVLWNRQKKKYDLAMGGLMLLFLAVFIGLQLAFFPEITAETLIIRATGSLAFTMLHVILVIGPLARLNRRFLPLLYNRRHLGVVTFLVALVHGAFNLIQFHALGNVDPLVSLFASNGHYFSLENFPFQVLGFFALLVLALMVATSHDFWLKNLGPTTWKALHMAVYFAYLALVLHVLLGTFQLEKPALLAWLTGGGALLVSGLHVAASRWGNREEIHPTSTDEFVLVCRVDEIADNRAKTVMVGSENIAVFRYDGKVSAVNNLCRHQHGPLGEGKVVDGCITCPWHGYQYLPHNGQSPPPFTEKLETYDVEIRDGKIYVNPKPHPEGTARPPAELPI